jgi:hypothetical protein
MTLTKHSKEIACIIHDLEYPAWEAAEEYLLRYMRKRGVLDQDCIHDLRAELNSEYHGASEDDLARWRCPKTPADQRKQKEAKRFISELSVHDWLHHSNKHLGKAPTSAQVMAKYVLASQEHPEVTNKEHDRKGVVAMTPKTRSFLKRWRRRWTVKYRKLPLGPTLTEADCQKKAMLKMYLRTQVVPTFATDTRYVAPLKIACQEEQIKSVSPIANKSACAHVRMCAGACASARQQGEH